MKYILCPTDFSEAANNALEYAAAYAEVTGANLTILHVEPILTGIEEEGLMKVQEMQEKYDEVTGLLQENCQLIKSKFDIACDYELKSKDLDDAIREDTETKKYNLIIMGTNGMDDYHQFYFGTNTWQAIKKAGCPVLVIPEGYSYKKLEKVIFATAYQEGDDIMITQLKMMLNYYNPDIDIIHVSKRDTPISREVFRGFCDRVQQILKSHHLIHCHRIVNEDAVLAIDEYVRKNNADLLTVATRYRNFMERIFHTSLTKRITSIADYPVLVFHY